MTEDKLIEAVDLMKRVVAAYESTEDYDAVALSEVMQEVRDFIQEITHV